MFFFTEFANHEKIINFYCYLLDHNAECEVTKQIWKRNYLNQYFPAVF